MEYIPKQRTINRGIENDWRKLKEMLNILSHQREKCKSTLRFHLTPVRIAKIKNIDDNLLMLERLWGKKKKHFCIAGGNASWYNPLWMSVWRFLRKLGNSLPQDPVIPLLGIYPKNAQSCHKDMCSTMIIAALFVITRTWKQPKCPSTKEWIRKMCHIYTTEY